MACQPWKKVSELFFTFFRHLAGPERANRREASEDTKLRPILDLLKSLPAHIRPTEAEVHALVTELVEAVPCVLCSADWVGEITMEEADAEYERVLKNLRPE